MKKLLLAILLSLSLVSSVSAGKPSGASGTQPLFFPSGYPLGGEKQDPVEQQSDQYEYVNPDTGLYDHRWWPGPLDCSADTHCVNNPTQCNWDVDDHWQIIEVGRVLYGNTSTSATWCTIGDTNKHHVIIYGMEADWSFGTGHGLSVYIRAPSPDLIVSLSYSTGKTFILPAISNGSGEFEYQICNSINYNPTDPALVPIPNSAGSPSHPDGVGVKTDITLTVTNPKRQAIRQIVGDINLSGASAQAGVCNHTWNHSEYPYNWWTP